MSTNDISLEQLKEQGVILFSRTTREGKNGMQLKLAINGSTNEIMQAAAELLVQVLVRTAHEDGKLDPAYLMMNVMMMECNYKRALLEVIEQEAADIQGDEHARHQ